MGGGANYDGTVFKITPGGALTTLYSFCPQGNCTDGDTPLAALTQATNGDLYGTTSRGGANYGGTVFKITPRATLTALYSFCSQSDCTDGEEPFAELVRGADGDFYGTTTSGGANGYGTVFKMTPGGTLTTLYSFCSQSGADGSRPEGGLAQATNRDFYGTTTGGGANGYGTVFKMTPGGTLTTLYSFCSQSGCADGSEAEGTLVQATDGNFYGTTYGQGIGRSGGTIFKITPIGTLATLFNFCSLQGGCPDGADPRAGLIQATDGTFYGTTKNSGSGAVFNDGTVFSLSVGLGPFVKTQPTSGKVGGAVKILGNNLTGTTSVTFNGTAAAFTVNSKGSAISTIVPTGATTGTVQVVTPSGTLSSNVAFRVRP